MRRFAALAFKIARDPNVAKIVYCRIYSGTLQRGDVVYNVTKNTKERVTRILQMHANKRETCDEAHAGDIVALVGLKKYHHRGYIDACLASNSVGINGISRAGHLCRD